MKAAHAQQGRRHAPQPAGDPQGATPQLPLLLLLLLLVVVVAVVVAIVVVQLLVDRGAEGEDTRHRSGRRGRGRRIRHGSSGAAPVAPPLELWKEHPLEEEVGRRVGHQESARDYQTVEGVVAPCERPRLGQDLEPCALLVPAPP